MRERERERERDDDGVARWNWSSLAGEGGVQVGPLGGVLLGSRWSNMGGGSGWYE